MIDGTLPVHPPGMRLAGRTVPRTLPNARAVAPGVALQHERVHRSSATVHSSHSQLDHASGSPLWICSCSQKLLRTAFGIIPLSFPSSMCDLFGEFASFSTTFRLQVTHARDQVIVSERNTSSNDSSPESSTVSLPSVPPQWHFGSRGRSSLPPEILEGIFLNHPGYLHEVEHPQGDAHECVKYHKCQLYCWATLSHVCRQWRYIALRCRPLWTTLPVSVHPEWMTELLSRSGNSPLLINAVSLEREMSDAVRTGRERSLEIALRELPRIRSLYLCVAQGLPDRILKLLAGPSPLLDGAYLSGVLADRDAIPVDMPDSGLDTSPEISIDEDLPLPRCLRLYHVNLGVASVGPCNSTLRRLAVTLFPTSGFPWQSLSQILHTFSMLPSLEELRFARRGGDSVFNEKVEEAQRVTLHRVHTLGLSAWACECTIILDALELPSLASLEVTARQCYLEDLQELAPILRTKISNLGTVRRLDIAGFRCADDPGPLWFYGYCRYDDDGPLSPIGHEHIFTIRLQDCIDYSECLSVICDDVLPCEDVHLLSLQGERVVDDDWRIMLRALKNLQFLVVNWERQPSDFFLELCRDASDEDVDAQDSMAPDEFSPVVPRLKELTLRNVHFDADVSGQWDHLRPPRYAQRPKTLLEGLKWSLRHRAKAGRKLDLWLEFCPGMYESMIGDLADATGYGGGIRALSVCGDRSMMDIND